MLLKESKLAAASRASQANAIAKLYSKDVMVILDVTQALNVETKEKVLGLKKLVAYITSELEKNEGRDCESSRYDGYYYGNNE